MQILLAERWSRDRYFKCKHENPISRDQASHVTNHGFAKIKCMQKPYNMMTVGDLTF